MTREEFMSGFDRLVNSFGAAGADRRATEYFQELQAESASVFKEACRRLIRDGDRFPPISTILRTIASINPKASDRIEKQDCAKCDGYGSVMFHGYAFRGRCEHGRRQSEKIAWAPETEIDRTNWANRIQREHDELYGPRP